MPLNATTKTTLTKLLPPPTLPRSNNGTSFGEKDDEERNIRLLEAQM